MKNLLDKAYALPPMRQDQADREKTERLD